MQAEPSFSLLCQSAFPFLHHRWSEHKDCQTMVSVLNTIRQQRPKGGLLENVLGLFEVSGAGDRSAYTFVMDHLRTSGYGCQHIIADLSDFHKCKRHRSASPPHAKTLRGFPPV